MNSLLVISRLIEHVILMTSYTLTPEHGREAQPLGDLIFTNLFVGSFWLTNEEFTKLERALVGRMVSIEKCKLTCNSVSVMVDRLTRA